MSGKAFGGRRVSRSEIFSIVEKLKNAGLDLVCDRYEICGSYRRERPDSGDIDIVVVPKNSEKFKEWHASLPWEIKIGKLAYYVLIDGVQIDLFVATNDEWGIKVLNYTGPPGFNQFIGAWCRMSDMTFTRSAIYDKNGIQISKGLDEKDIFKLIKMDFIEPKNRQTILGAPK